MAASASKRSESECQDVGSAGPAHPRRAAFIHGPELERYSYPAECPFRPERAAETVRILQTIGQLSGPGLRQVAPVAATDGEMAAFHPVGYLEILRRASKGHLDLAGLGAGLGTPDTPVFAGLFEYAALACGASLTGARLLLAGDVQVAFNPSGGYHHARPAQASGFCYINDVVLACMALARAGRRVLFLDLDVHHGDGVQEAFWERRDVMVISLHESGKTLFPGTGWEDQIGAGDGTGFTVNVPLPAGICDDAYLRAYRALVEPLIRAFNPDAIVVELGMDGLAGDPLAHLALTNNAYADVVESVMALGRPVLATGGGGYHLAKTARAWALAWTVLAGTEAASRDQAAGMGGVFLATSDWHGGLRDRMLVLDAARRRELAAAVEAVIERVKRNVFPRHGL